MASAWVWFPTTPEDGGGVRRSPIGGAEVAHADMRRRPAASAKPPPSKEAMAKAVETEVGRAWESCQG
eukprot:61722-Alexandrium_andersonii.AAC.1